MLHEILLSLWECSTVLPEIFHADLIELDKYLHPGERALLKRIMKIIKEYNLIKTFIHKRSFDEFDGPSPGLYSRALGEGMNEALQPFRQEIIELENTVMNDSHTPLSLILYRVEKYITLFSVLNSIIREIETQRLHGCKLLQCLHRYMSTGVLEVKQALIKMTHCVHIIFYKHLTSWLLYGHLNDIHQEFFIQKVTPQSENESDKKSNVEMWSYDIKIDMLPSYIRPSLATQILIIGQTIIMFGNDPRKKKDFSAIAESKNSIWGEKENLYFCKLQNLQTKAMFNIVEFEHTIDELKKCVTELLWKVAIEEAQLMQQFKLIKDVYLMGRGDLFLEFIRHTSHILNKPPTNYTSRDINLAFQMSLRKIHLNDETAMDSFNFIVPVTNGKNEDSDATDNTEFTETERKDPIENRGWSLIILKYEVIWPLHLLFSPSILTDYNTIFRFLLRVKKTQINLWNLWSEHMYSKNIDMGIVQLRNHLIFIVDNLQYYLQVDVLESQYTIMESNLKNTRNFEDVQRAHSIFLSNVISQTFLSNGTLKKENSINKLINLILRLCDDFILQASMWKKENLLITEKEDLKTLSDTLDSLMDWLTKTLNRARTQPSGEHLGQLLLRLDFNRWLSKQS